MAGHPREIAMLCSWSPAIIEAQWLHRADPMPYRRAMRFTWVAWLFLLPACGDFFEKLGNSDQGYFEISPQNSLARGGWLTYTVRDYELGSTGSSNIGFELLGVSDDSTAHILSVGQTTADLVVQGLAAGSSHVDFRAVANGESRDDGFTLTVEEVTRLGFDPCHSNGTYVRGTDGRVSYTFNPGNYPTAKGLGLYPFTMNPTDAITLRTDVSTDTNWVFTIPPAAPAQIVLASSLPGDSARFTMNIIDRSAIDGVFPTATIATEGTTMQLDLLPSAAGVPVCVQAKRKVTTTTPSACQLLTDDGDVPFLTTYEDSVQVDFIGTGTCRLVLEIAELIFSAAMTAVTVSPHPSGGGGDWDD
jgi:hypothetical protein